MFFAEQENANGPSLALAHAPLVRPWTRLQNSGLYTVIRDRIGFPTDMIVIGLPDGPSATFLIGGSRGRVALARQRH
jgi:hypothetical protein